MTKINGAVRLRVMVVAILIALVGLFINCGSAYAADGDWYDYTDNGSSISYRVDPDTGVMTIKPTVDGDVGILDYTERRWADHEEYSRPPWNSKTNVTKVVIEGRIDVYGSTSYMFYGFENLRSIEGLEFLDTSNVQWMSRMFQRCLRLHDLDLRTFDTSNVIQMYEMFEYCRGLRELNITGWDTSSCINMRSMFRNTWIDFLDVSSLDTQNVTNMSSMFEQYGYSFDPAGNGSQLIIGLNNFDTSSCTDMNRMFYGNSSLNAAVNTLNGSMAISNWDVSNVTDMSYMFSGCNSSAFAILDLHNWDTSSVTSMASMFAVCSGLTEIKGVEDFDTSNVTTFDSMFYACPKLTSLDLSNWDTSSVTRMYEMFCGCKGLTLLDVSSFDTSTVTTMAKMFNGCSSLTSLDLSNFDMSNVVYTQNFTDGDAVLSKVLLPETFNAQLHVPANNAIYTGKWIREDETFGPFTPAELKNSYMSFMAGTWVWEVQPDHAVVNFDANGGFLASSSSTVVDSFDPVSLPSNQLSRYGYNLGGWNTKADGSGESFSVDGSFAPSEMGKTYTLYAQWEDDINIGYVVETYLQRRDLSTDVNDYELDKSVHIITQPGQTEATVLPPGVPAGYHLSSVNTTQETTLVLDPNVEQVVKYYCDRDLYSIVFNRNGADMGVDMNPMHIAANAVEALLENSYVWLGHAFVGWSTDSEATDPEYADGQNVINLGEDGDEIDLYAIWKALSPELSSEAGEYFIRLKGGESAEIIGLPHGTEYSIEEVNLPSGWRQTGSVGENGEISVNTTQEATFTNAYSAEGDVQIEVRKQLNGAVLKEGQFSFELLDNNGSVISRSVNGYDVNTDGVISGSDEIAAVVFDPISYTEEGTYNYIIREVVGNDDAIEYDSTEMAVVVTVVDVGQGNLDAVYQITNDDGVFENSVATTTLQLSKVIAGATDVSENKTFLLDVELRNADDTPYTGTVNTSGFSEWATPNLNQDGTRRQGSGVSGFDDYEESVTYVGVINIEGVESLHAEFDYAYPDGECLIYFGERSDILALNGQVYSPIPGTPDAFIQSPVVYDGLSYTELDIPGDTATIVFHGSRDSTSTPNEWTNYGVHVKARAGVTNTVNGGHVLIPIVGGKTIELTGLPVGTKYSVTESSANGWTQTSSENLTGECVSDDIASASITNTYLTQGVWTPKATKVLTGADMVENAYWFELLDENDEVVSRGSNDENGVVAFTSLLYNGEDHNKTYTYTMREVPGENGAMDYDSHTETVVVKPVDNGDGTMTIMESHDGGATFTSSDESESSSFTNTTNPDVKSVKVTKAWLYDGVNTEWPENATVEAVLMNGSTEIDRKPLTKDSPSAVFSDLPVKDIYDVEIEYTVVEEVSAGGIDFTQEVIQVLSNDALDTWLLRNTIKHPVEVPFTGGDLVLQLLWIALAGVVIGYIVWFNVREHKNEELGDVS